MASLRDIANATGYSLSTVSRALNADPRISTATTATVRETAQRLGYRENVQAKVLAGRNARLVGFMASSLRYPWDNEVMRGVEQAAKEAGYRVLIALYHDDPERTETYRQLLEQPLFDGVVVGWSGWQWRRESLGDKPVVYVDLWPAQLNGARVVTSDHALTAALLIDSFARQQVCRVRYVGHGGRNTVESARCEAIERECAQRGLDLVRMEPSTETLEYAVAKLSAQDAVVVEPGNAFSVPSGVRPAACLAAFFDERPAELAELLPRSVRVIQDHVTMGRVAVGVLTDLIAGNSPPEFRCIPVGVVPYQTNDR